MVSTIRAAIPRVCQCNPYIGTLPRTSDERPLEHYSDRRTYGRKETFADNLVSRGSGWRAGGISGLNLISACHFERVNSRSVQHFYIRFPIGGVTAATDRFESTAVQYPDFTAMIFYKLATLQFAGSHRDAYAADTEHVGEEFMCNVKTVRVRAIFALRGTILRR